MVKAVSAYQRKLKVRRTHARRSLVAKSVLLLASLLMNYCVSAAEAPTPEVLKICRSKLSSESDAILIDQWSTRPLPTDYRQAVRFELRYGVVSGWLTHKNPSGTLTVVIRTVDPETKERSFLVLTKDRGVTLKHDVYAFEFAFSKREHDGVTGLFFCSKTGPSPEWVWDGKDWKVVK